VAELCDEVQLAIAEMRLTPDVISHAKGCEECGFALQLSSLLAVDGATESSPAARLGEAFESGRELLLGRYRLEALLGEGGQGRVYRAIDTNMRDQPVALKVVRLDHHSLDEAAHARQVTHPNVCRVNYTIEHGAVRLIEMELIDGPTLATRIGKLSPPEVRAVFRDVCEGVRAIHAAGLLHLDLNPRNVLLRDGRVPVVTDFGFSARVGNIGRGAAPEYMAPELKAGEPADVRADVYSLGVLLKKLSGPQAPTSVRGVIARATALRPIDRHPDVPSLLATYERALRRPRQLRILVAAIVVVAAAGVALPATLLRPRRGRPHGAVVLHGQAANGKLLAAAELFNAVDGRWHSLPDDPVPGLCAARALALRDGRLMVIGGGGPTGCNDNRTTTNAVRLLDPAQAKWSVPACQPACIELDGRTFVKKANKWIPGECNPHGSCPIYGRNRFATATLADGKLFIFGGCAGGCNGPNALEQTLAGAFELGRVAEIYDPVSDIWQSSPRALEERRADGHAVVVGDAVLVCGGSDGFSTLLTSCELYDFNSDFNGQPPWRHTGATPKPVADMVRLPNGQVLALLAGDLDHAWLWAGESWTVGPSLPVRSEGGRFTPLANGDVLLTGGRADGKALRAAQLFVTAESAWKRLPDMAVARFGHAAALLDDGRVIIAGGCDGGATASAELFDPVSARFHDAPPMGVARCDATAVATN
jgi:hypothetical protein